LDLRDFGKKPKAEPQVQPRAGIGAQTPERHLHHGKTGRVEPLGGIAAFLWE
jgi:hypothetical protein